MDAKSKLEMMDMLRHVAPLATKLEKYLIELEPDPFHRSMILAMTLAANVVAAADDDADMQQGKRLMINTFGGFCDLAQKTKNQL